MIARYELTVTIDVTIEEDDDPQEYVTRSQKRFIERSIGELIVKNYKNYDIELTNAELVEDNYV